MIDNLNVGVSFEEIVLGLLGNVKYVWSLGRQLLNIHSLMVALPHNRERQGSVLRAEMRKFELPSDWRLEHANQLSSLTMVQSSSYLVE